MSQVRPCLGKSKKGEPEHTVQFDIPNARVMTE